jgi:F0F1-type ATP synthase membrane subunit b/b'
MSNFSQKGAVNGFSSRKAIFVGVLAALTIVLLLGLVGTSAGLSLFSPTKSTLYSLSIGAILWLFFSTIASAYVGGWVASYFNPATACKNGILNGFIVSSVSLFIVLGLAFSGIGMLISSSFRGLQYALSATQESADSIITVAKSVSKLSPQLNETAKKAMPSLKPITDKINQEVVELLPEADESLVKKIKANLEEAMASYLNSIESSNNEATKEKLVSALREATGKSSEEINQKIEEWKNDYSEAKEKVYQKVVEVSKDTAKVLSQFALLNFFILISGLVAGIIGGCHGIRKEYHCE